jgi:TonB family protein
LIYFKIGRDGSVKDLLIKKPSGDDIFDQQASRSIILASPFPPLPSGYKEEDLGVFFEFSYTD